MADAADAAIQFVSGRDRPDLDTDRMLLFAVLRAIEVLGEAASKVTAQTRAASPAIPWSAIVSMRHRLIHGYFDIDVDVVWRTVSAELPALARQLRVLLTE